MAEGAVFAPRPAPNHKETTMKLFKTLAAAGLAAVFAAAPVQAALTSNMGDIASPNTVTFDEFLGLLGAGPTQVGATIGQDVVFTSSLPSTLGAYIAELGSNGMWGAGKVFAATGTPDDLVPGFGLLHYTFTGKVTSGAGAFLNSFDGGPILMIAYGVGTTILEAHVVTASTPAGFNEGAFFGIVRPGTDIRAIAFGGTGLVMDDLTFATPVPEPETYALLLAGLGLVGWAARRRSRA
jgi:hypothetical protein